MTQTVRVIAHVSALPGQEETLKALLLELVEASRAEPGCLRYELLQSRLNPTQFTFVEEWQTEEAVAAHLQSPHVEEVFREGAELLAAPPEIQHYRSLA